jgi:poly-gamma-glutamate capsule biosynthesis protein CapA/YwtB (metallophosphatase superfamily)
VLRAGGRSGSLLMAVLGFAGCGQEGTEPPPFVAPPAEAAEAPAPSVDAADASPAATTLLLSAIGDCTLGTDHKIRRAPGSFPVVIEQAGEDYRYPFSGVLQVLSQDDLTIANLETTLTDADAPDDGHLHFSGKPAYVQMLKEGSVELVNFANNHSHDFGMRGYADTLATLAAAGVGAFGNGSADLRTVRGVEVVDLGFTGGDPGVLPEVVREVKEAKTGANLVIVSFHWGAEGSNTPNSVQRLLGHAAVDAGADLVLGTHPHVLQGIEAYRGKRIVYSLGNFVFGGHSNPADKDSIIYQAVFAEKEGRMEQAEERLLPVRISTSTQRNDYRPVLLEGAERDRVLARVEEYSAALGKPGGGSGR